MELGDMCKLPLELNKINPMFQCLRRIIYNGDFEGYTNRLDWWRLLYSPSYVTISWPGGHWGTEIFEKTTWYKDVQKLPYSYCILCHASLWALMRFFVFYFQSICRSGRSNDSGNVWKKSTPLRVLSTDLTLHINSSSLCVKRSPQQLAPPGLTKWICWMNWIN